MESLTHKGKVGILESYRYTYDLAGNKLQTERAETFIGELEKQEEYGDNGLGKRVSQNISQAENQEKLNPMKQIEYTLDLTRQYYDLLSYEDKLSSKKQDFIWDGNATGMLEEGTDSYYLQDDLGSVMNLTDADGGSRELFVFDEFGMPVVHRNIGNSVHGTEEMGLMAEPQKFAGMAQPFAFTGYQPDEITGLFYAQARRYDAGAGRFVSEDKIKGFAGSLTSEVVSNGIENVNWKNVDVDTVSGVINGGVAGTGVGIPALMPTGAVLGSGSIDGGINKSSRCGNI